MASAAFGFAAFDGLSVEFDHLVNDCEAEFLAFTEAGLTHGRTSAQARSNGQRLQSCLKEQDTRLQLVRTHCSSQLDVLNRCLEGRSGDQLLKCTAVLENFVGCARRTLA